MRKKLIMVVLGAMLLCVGCKTSTTRYADGEVMLWDKFVVIEEQCEVSDSLYIAYDKNSKVMYYIGYSRYFSGFSPIYDENGNVKIYDKSER